MSSPFNFCFEICFLFRRYGGVDGGRFCIEGGTRCGKGEGLHVFRVDNSDEVQVYKKYNTVRPEKLNLKRGLA